MHRQSKFAQLQLAEPLLRALFNEGYTEATPIQLKAIPAALQGRDILGSAQTGTGKTAAFALPILQRLSATPAAPGVKVRCLVLSPTRELATQIGESFATYGRHLKLRHTIVFGGVGQNPQADALRRGVDILIATPGRLLDLIQQRLCDLRGVEILVLDEADRMLDMGFIRDVRKIVADHSLQAPDHALFSHDARGNPRPGRRPAASSGGRSGRAQSSTADGVEQFVYHVEKRNKPLLLAHLVQNLPMSRAIVFARTKRGADKLVSHLHRVGIAAEAIHSNKSQNARQRALAAFRADKVGVLVATDIASRGIDIDGITHVVNYDLTHEPETYVHRIGRTARAGATGAAVAFCDPEEIPNLKAIEKLIQHRIKVRSDHPKYPSASPAAHNVPRPEASPAGDRPTRPPPPCRPPACPGAHSAPRPAAARRSSHPFARHHGPSRPHSAQPARSGRH